MKKNYFLLFLVMSMFNSVAANAQFVDGKYFLQNVESERYWGVGNDWGTQASLVKNPEYVTLVSNDDGTYKMEAQVSNGGTNYYFGGDYMDGGEAGADSLTIEKSKLGDYYTIKGKNGYYGYDKNSTVLGKNMGENSVEVLWQIISEEAMIASLANATAENPVDATFLILDPNFGRNNRNQGAWTVSADCTNKNLSGGNDINRCAESYHSTFTISQTIADAPKGVYKLTAQGFYRQDGTDNDNLPVFFINDETSVFPLKTGSEDNMSNASVSFSAGLYAAEPIFIELAEDGDITVGTKLENNKSLWCIWDNFELTYYGPDATITDVKFGDLIKRVNALRAQAAELKDNENVSAVTAKALEAAISASEDIEATEEAYNSAIVTLNAAISQANKDIANKPAIDALYALTEITNIYTSEAYTTYKAWVDGLKESFDAGTLVETVENPNDNLGHRHENSFDDLLLSAWTIGGEQAADYTKSLYINVWSTEGNNDGTEFRTPFFEYWTGDANSLSATNITATLTDIPAGAYEISAWVRVRAKNGTNATDATGITLSINGDKSVDVTEGKDVGQFNLAEYKTRGVVGDDGRLDVTFMVEEDNNISWLSFKNVKYKRVYDITVNPCKNGTVSVDVSDAVEGDSITIHTKPDGEYTLTELSVTTASGVSVEVIDNSVFVMPAEPVTIDATFKIYAEVDVTAQFPTDWKGWNGATGYTAANVVPMVTTNDGRYVQVCERYNGDSATEGTVFTRTLTGLTNGLYRVELYGAAAYTSGRGIDSDITYDDIYSTDAVYLYAETENSIAKQYIPVDWATVLNSVNTAVLDNIEVTDGTIEVGMFNVKRYTNWHIVQVKGITALVDIEEHFANRLNRAKELLSDETYSIIIGEERTTLKVIIDNSEVTEPTIKAFNAAISTVEEGIALFTSAYESYATLEATKEFVAGRTYPYASEEKKKAAELMLTVEANTAYDALVKEDALLRSYRQYAESSALLEGIEDAIEMTDVIVNPRAEESINGWTLILGAGSNGYINAVGGRPWTDGNDSIRNIYFDGGNWDAESWDVTFEQEIELEAGHYLLTVMGSSSENVDMTLFVGDATTQMFTVGAYGGLFNNGWEQTSLEFELTDYTYVNIGIHGVANGLYNWMSFSDFRLVAFPEGIPTDITNVDATPAIKADGKYIENGQIVIYRGGIKYNAAGIVIR